MNDQEARKLVEAVEASLECLEALAETERAAAHQAITHLCELYGEALRRLLAEGDRRADASWLPRFARTDELLSHLLLLHGLHPDGEQPLEKLLAADAAVATAAAAARDRRTGREPELVTLGTHRLRDVDREPLGGVEAHQAPGVEGVAP